MAGNGKENSDVKQEEVYLPKQIGNGSIIKYFNKTPPAKRKNDVVCPHFYELKYANGCAYDCQWCYLNGTFRFKKDEFGIPKGNEPRRKNGRMIRQDVEEALRKIRPRQLFNAGEVNDALLFEADLQLIILPLFADEHVNEVGHKLLLLTKSDSLRWTSQADSNTTILSHSVNARYVASRWELKAPSVINRLEASRRAANLGYETRLRIDPMVPVESWWVGYKALVEDIMKFNPHVDVITLGSLRGLQSTLNAGHAMGKDMSWTKYLDKSEKTNWGLKVPQEKRVEMYQTVIDHLKDLGYKGDIALCKETLGVWKELGMKPKEAKCNCVL